MDKKTIILKRMQEIQESIRIRKGARAFLTLGSAGLEVDRLDNYSDLDFFLIVEDGYKNHFIDNLDWLCEVSKPGFYFRNTKDGYKFLYADGVFCEFAVFEESEMKTAQFSKGALRWSVSDFDTSLCEPSQIPSPWHPESLDWALQEALTCLYVGLNRYARGELLSGTRFVQNYAVDLILASSSYLAQEESTFVDGFQHERRYETHYPSIATSLPDMIQGYTRTRESAAEILKFIELYYEVNPYLKAEIQSLL